MAFAERAPVFAFRDPQRKQKLVAALPAVEKAISKEIKAQGLPGVAVGIVIDGELAWSKGYGVVAPGGAAPDADTVYRIGSITKSFTALALLALRDDGALQIDDPLVKWVPEASGLVYPSRDARPITLRQLASHRSGLPGMGTFEPETGPSEQTVVSSLSTVTLESTPGTRWHYSNLGFGLLGIAISHAAKAPYHEVVTRRILEPLGMTSTVWGHEQVPAGKLAPAFEDGPQGRTIKKVNARLGAIAGAGGIYSSVRDMAKYVAFQLAAYPPRDDDERGQIRRASVRESHSTGVLTHLRDRPPVVAASYGFGWGVARTCRFDDLTGHNGGIDSYGAEVLFSPSRGVGVIVLTNFRPNNTRAIIDTALAELAKTGALQPRETEAAPPVREAVQRLLDVYHQWDEAKLNAALARPMQPEERAELATYHQLHGTCTTFEPVRMESPTSGTFAVKCERGTFELTLQANNAGRIEGFYGFSRGITPPLAFAKTARAVLALHQKWDDKLYAMHFAKGPMSVEQVKQQAMPFKATHGECKLGAPLHEGFDWGYEVICTKESFEMFVTTAADNPTLVTGLVFHPLRTAPKKCD